MRKFKITNIDYDITVDDIDDILEDWEIEYNMYGKVNYAKRLREIVNGIPEELIVELDKEDIENESDIEDLLTDKISNKTGWLVNSFKFKELKGE